MLTDLTANPGETTNYANDPSYAGIRAMLSKELMTNLSQRGLTPLSEDRTIKNIRKVEAELRGKQNKKKKAKDDYEE
jgi:hypothetical protein